MEFWFTMFKDIMYMIILFVMIPLWIGNIWNYFFPNTSKLITFIQAWIIGFISMLAVAQLILVPLVALGKTLTVALAVWKVALIVLTIISLLLYIKKINNSETGKTIVTHSHGIFGRNRYMSVLFLVVTILILIQAYIPARYEHSDDDDSRFIAEEVSAVVHDTMYVDDPITATQMYWDLGEVKKDLTSPWAMYIAMCSRMSNIPPAALSHSYLPFFLIVLCYAVYFLIGYELTDRNREKTCLFLLFVSIFNLWGYTSTHTMASMLLLRIWQGKAICASLILPFIFYVMYCLLNKSYERKWLIILYITSFAASLLSGVGIITVPVLYGIYSVIDYVFFKDMKKMLAILGAILPSLLYLLYYLVR